MGTCVLLIVLAWNVVRFWSTTAAVVMSLVAAVIPPVAVVVANLGALAGPTAREDRDPSRRTRGINPPPDLRARSGEPGPSDASLRDPGDSR